MLLDIFVTIPLLLITNIAWYIRVGLILICLIALFAVAMGALCFYKVREDGHSAPHGHRPEPLPQP
jgi:hypothetical protein